MKTSLIILAIALGSVTAAFSDQTYSTYAGQSGLVTNAQVQQWVLEKESASAFRNMSIADRWDGRGPGSFADRWNPNSFGSIESRWDLRKR
jgi:hypothetical protein